MTLSMGGTKVKLKVDAQATPRYAIFVFFVTKNSVKELMMQSQSDDGLMM
jgi:hypothetical protein